MMSGMTAMTGITRDQALLLLLLLLLFCFPASLTQEGKDYRDKGRGQDRRL